MTDPYLYHRSGEVWYYAFVHGKQRYKGSTGKTNKTEALQIAREIKIATLSGQDEFNPETAFASELFKLYRQRRMSKRPEKAKKLADVWADRFKEFFGDVPLSTITTFKCEDFRDWLLEQETRCKKWDKQKKLSAKTVSEILVWLSSVYKYFKIQNPVVSIERPKKNKEQTLDETIQFYSDKELEKIINASKNTVFELPLLVLLYSGCRPAELRFLSNTKKEIDRKKKIVYFIDKRKRVRGIQLTGEPFDKAWDALMRWIEVNNIEEGEKLFPQGSQWFKRSWHRILAKAEMPLCRTHQLRHQFTKMLYYDYGYELSEISKFGGYSTDTVYRVYSNILVQRPKTKEEAKKNAVVSPRPKGWYYRKLKPEARELLSKLINATPALREAYRLHARLGVHEFKEFGPIADEQETVTINKSDYETLLSRIEAFEGK